jgi:hypothetical protein
LTSAIQKIAATDIVDIIAPVTTIFFTVATSIVEVISDYGYCDMITFILKWCQNQLHFRCSTYAQKGNEITFSIQLVLYQNSSRINGNNQNSMLTGVTGMIASSWLWLLWHGHIHTKTDVKIASGLRYGCSIDA